MGRFKRSKKSRQVELKCFEREGLYVVCKKVNGGWKQLNGRTYASCKACTKSIGTTECF